MTKDWDSSIGAGDATGKVREGAVDGLQRATEHLLQVSREQVPIEEATLERSGRASVDEESLTGAVSYDGPYAVTQHERMDFRHDPGRKAKYLEDPMNSERDALAKIIAESIRRKLGTS